MDKRYEHAETERLMQELWDKEGIYRFDPGAEGEVYSIDTPPPTVSGRLHIGHLFSYTQAEMIARFRRMQGYNVFYPFGFDDNGLPTERLAERDEGFTAANLPRNELISRCERVSAGYESEFKAFWKSLGFSVDWSAEFRTISPEVSRISQRLFLDLVQAGKAYAQETPVLWCTECRTSIAQAELDVAERESDMVYIPFQAGQTVLEVATTRPELLYGCVCLFVHPDDDRYQAFVGGKASVPLYKFEVPVLSDAKVDPQRGTGIVMCATFGDSTDAEWYRDHKLPFRNTILESGTMAEEIPGLGGLSVPAARKRMIQMLEESDLLLRSEPVVHTVGTHERCGKETEISLSRQWYIDILTDKERYLEAGGEINWYPGHMKQRYIAWVENLKWDWCISRQRSFGVPFPVWYCTDCGTPVFAEQGDLPVDPLERAYEGICSCGCSVFEPEKAVLDTWATSSVTPQIHERSGINLAPMSMRTHAHEIIRTWTFYTIVRSLYHTGKLPWKDLMICGFVLAKKGEKISKSKNNDANDPTALIRTYSADALRYWTAGAKLGVDTFFSADELSVPKRFMTKLWNASKFAISHLGERNPNPDIKLLPIDKWMIERTKEASARATELMYQYEIGAARQVIDDLFWKDFCDNYIELVKERLYRPDLHGLDGHESGQHGLYYALLNILKLYAVYVPHITEYIYQNFFRAFEKKPSIHLTRWVQSGNVDTELLAFGEKVKESLTAMRKYKAERNLSMRAEMDVLKIRPDPGQREWFMLTLKDIEACSHAREIRIL